MVHALRDSIMAWEEIVTGKVSSALWCNNSANLRDFLVPKNTKSCCCCWRWVENRKKEKRIKLLRWLPYQWESPRCINAWFWQCWTIKLTRSSRDCREAHLSLHAHFGAVSLCGDDRFSLCLPDFANHSLNILSHFQVARARARGLFFSKIINWSNSFYSYTLLIWQLPDWPCRDCDEKTGATSFIPAAAGPQSSAIN